MIYALVERIYDSSNSLTQDCNVEITNSGQKAIKITQDFLNKYEETSPNSRRLVQTRKDVGLKPIAPNSTGFHSQVTVDTMDNSDPENPIMIRHVLTVYCHDDFK